MTGAKLQVENHDFLVGPWHKKWFVPDKKRAEQKVSGKKASSNLLETFVYRMSSLRNRNQATRCPVLKISNLEFTRLTYSLPEFRKLKDFWNLWTSLNRPTLFVIECEDTKDILAIDTQGFDYARYKAPCKKADLNL